MIRLAGFTIHAESHHLNGVFPGSWRRPTLRKTRRSIFKRRRFNCELKLSIDPYLHLADPTCTGCMALNIDRLSLWDS